MPAHRIALSSGNIAVTAFDDSRPLFKFLPAKFAEDLVTLGRLRVGTLFSFRSLESHGPARGDPREGATGAVALVDDLTLTPENVLPPFFAQMLTPPKEGSNRFQDSIFELATEDQDFYVYSLTAVPLKRLFQAFDCDACVRIARPRSFFEALSNALSDRLPSSDEPVASMKPIVYGSRHGQHNPAFDAPGPYVKPPHYSYQREVRMLWTPEGAPIEPFIFTVPALCQYCDTVAYRDDTPSR